MKLTIFGATGAVGSELVRQALAAGHTVTVFVRDAALVPQSHAILVVRGILHDFAAISRAVQGADAVLSALGARQNTADQVVLFRTALEHITRAMTEQGVKRLVSISGAGVLLPGDHITLGRRAVRALLLLVSKYFALAKEAEAAVIRASTLDWVLVRPPRMVAGPKTGRYRVLPDRVPSPKISRGDVADLMLKCAVSDEWVHRGPIPGY